MTRVSKMLPGLQKSPQDSPRARVSPAGQPRNFHGWTTQYNRLQIMNLSRTNIKTMV